MAQRQRQNRDQRGRGDRGGGQQQGGRRQPTPKLEKFFFSGNRKELKVCVIVSEGNRPKANVQITFWLGDLDNPLLYRYGEQPEEGGELMSVAAETDGSGMATALLDLTNYAQQSTLSAMIHGTNQFIGRELPVEAEGPVKVPKPQRPGKLDDFSVSGTLSRLKITVTVSDDDGPKSNARVQFWLGDQSNLKQFLYGRSDQSGLPFELLTTSNGVGIGELNVSSFEATRISAMLVGTTRLVTRELPTVEAEGPVKVPKPNRIKLLQEEKELVYPQLKGPVHFQTLSNSGQPESAKIIIDSDQRISLEILSSDKKKPLVVKNLTRWSGKTDSSGLLLATIAFFSSPTRLRIIHLDSGQSIYVSLHRKKELKL